MQFIRSVLSAGQHGNLRLPEDEKSAALDVAYADVKAAFTYYLENINQDRPFIIAGYSQGSIMTKMLLADVMKDPSLAKRMVAAYPLGIAVPQSYMDENSHLKFAEGANDTGVVVAFNTCSNEVAATIQFGDGLAINPINWKREATPAPASENLGSVFFDEYTYEKSEVSNYADATVDVENGVVVCSTITDNNKYAISAPKFDDNVYHMTEYGFYYKNLQENVANRIAHYASLVD